MASAYRAPSALLGTEKDYRYLYGPFVIGVSTKYSLSLEKILKNQRLAIDRGTVYPVTKWTRDYLLGWPFDTAKLACAHVNLPPTNRNTLAYDYFSYTEKEGNVVSGFFIIPNIKCYALPESPHFFSFSDLENISFKT